MRQMIKRLKNEKGLTLVELLAVVVILAIVAGIAFVMIGNVIENAKKDAVVADALQVISAAKLYEVSEPGDFESVTVSVLQTGDGGGYLNTLHDPWGKGEEDDSEYGKNGTVTKDEDGNYTVTELIASGCTINSTESQLINEGRDRCGTE